MHRADIWVWTDNRSQAQTNKGYAYCIESVLANGKTHRVYEDKTINGDGTYGGIVGSWNKVVLVAIAEALERFRMNAEVTIHSDNRWALNMLKNHLPEWEKADFRKRNNEAVANEAEWRRIAKCGHEHGLQFEIDPVGFDRSPELYRKVFAGDKEESNV